MKYILLIAIFFFGINSSAISQRGPGGNKGKIKHLISELELSDTQADELKNIFEAMKEDSETTDREEKRAAMEVAISGLLTEEQLAKYNALKLDRKGPRGNKGKAGKKGRAMKKGVAKDEETLNRLKEMRTELDESISSDDKIHIDDLRKSFADRKEELKENRGAYKELSDDEKKEFREERKANRDEMKADLKQLHELAEIYKAEMKTLFEDNKDFFEEKKAEKKEEWKAKKEEWKEKRGEQKEERRSGQENRGNKLERKHSKKDHAKPRGGHLIKEAKFLLMDPDALTSNAKEIIEDLNTISVSPNPASVMTNITYEVKNDGKVRVEIRDESGRIYEVIANELMEAGTYTKAIEISKYQDKTYYISISDGKSITTEKLLIQK